MLSTFRSRKKIFSRKDGLLHPFGLSLYDNTLYWSDWEKKGILAAKLDTKNTNIKMLRGNLQRVFGVEIYSARRQTGKENLSTRSSVVLYPLRTKESLEQHKNNGNHGKDQIKNILVLPVIFEYREYKIMSG